MIDSYRISLLICILNHLAEKSGSQSAGAGDADRPETGNAEKLHESKQTSSVSDSANNPT